MLLYLGNNRYETYLENGEKIELTCDDLKNLLDSMKQLKPTHLGDDYHHLHEHISCKKETKKFENLLDELEEYVDSVDSDINTIHNFNMGCCDVREAETLRNVFNALEKLTKKYKELGSNDF